MENPEEQEINRKISKEQEINRKRKNNDDEEEDNDFLTLSLSYHPFKTRHSPSAEQPLMPPATLPPLRPPPPPQELPSFAAPNQLYPLYSPSFPTHPWSMQNLFSQTIPQTPLQLSPTHSLFVPPFLPEPALSTTHFLYNYQEPMTSPSPVPAGPSPSPFSRSMRNRRNPSQGPREGKSKKIPIFFPWGTDLRARVQSLKDLREKRILTITGKVECKTCEKSYEMGFTLEDKFTEVSSFIARNKCSMHDRAPPMWVHPILPTCKNCGNSVKPVISEKKRSINWLFLLLGQILGCLTLEQLKYFCKHTENHRTGAKDRVLYLAYLGLCKQLDPSGPFDRY